MSQLGALLVTRRQRWAVALCATMLTASVAVASASTVSGQDAQLEPGSVVVTTEVLGSLVRQLVGDAGEVSVLMDGGANPHTFAPSARDAERIENADLVVSNGLDLEEGLLSMLESAQADGVTWFQAADQITVRELEAGGDEAVDHGEAGAVPATDGPGETIADPHIWTDPLVMRDVVQALVPVLAGVGIDTGDRAATLVADLEALDAEVVAILSVVPDEHRKLVTGHRSMGYFADRYGFEQIGTVIPSLSTNGEPTARELVQLIGDIRELGVPVVFTEVGTPESVARAVADDSGAELVSLSTSQLPAEGTYQSLIRDLATTVAEALGA